MNILSIIDIYGRFFLKIFFINIYLYFIYLKISNNKNNNTKKFLLIVFCSLLISTLYIILMKYTYSSLAMLIVYLLFGMIIKYILEQKFNYSAVVLIISFILTYTAYLISVLASGTILRIINQDISYKNPISLIIIPIIMIVLYNFIVKIKRLKNGFYFLKNIDRIEQLGKFINITSIIVVIVFGLLQDSRNIIVNTLLFVITIILCISLTIWIKSQITKTYKSNMRDRTIEIQKTEIDEKDKIIEDLKSENLKLATTIHKYNHKFSSLESAMKNAIDIDNKTEFANELSIILKETADTIENFSKEVCVNKNKLPLTNIPGIDNMFKYMQEEAIKNNINFDLKINESINYLVENIIPKEKFEILIGDHLKDAIIAINASDNSYKSILVTLGLVENCYELNIYDTGIEFEIDTLLKLGKEQVTTHKDTGGSGIGFMTTFETLKNCKASLIIEEYKPETTNYTKAVIIRFDNKNEYKIISYRANEIRKFKKGYNMVIQNLI